MRPFSEMSGDLASVSLMIETDDVRPVKHLHGVIGIDLGVAAFATVSNGDVIEGPAHGVALKRLRRANKTLARKRRGSHNFRKAKARLARVHRRMAASAVTRPTS